MLWYSEPFGKAACRCCSTIQSAVLLIGRYELCNQYGIYLMDEANVETHGFEPSFTKKNAHPACWPEWHDAIVDRGVRMVSHPS